MRRKFIFTFIALVLLALFLFSLGGELLVDGLWFSSVGYFTVFWVALYAKSLLFLIFSAVAFLFAFANGYFAHRFTSPGGPVSPISEWVSRRARKEDRVPWAESIKHRIPWSKGILVASMALGIFLGTGGPIHWDVFLKFFHQVPFNYTDRIFNRDIGFYLFSLPTYSILKTWLMACLVMTFFLTLGVYWLKGAIFIPYRSGPYVSKFLLVHASVLLGLFFLIKSWSYYLERFFLLYNNNGVVVGASYTDIHVRLPLLNLLIFLGLSAAFLSFLNVYLRSVKLLLVAIAVVFGTSLIVYNGLPSLYQSYLVKPNEFTLESPYIKNNIEFTQRAYKLNETLARDFPAKEKLTYAKLKENSSTIDNIRLWDHRPLLDTFKQLQIIRLYYDFADVDIDRYYINGKYQQVMLSAREIKQSLIPENAQTWINLRFKFTHGYGLVMSPVTLKSSEGLPLFYIKDIPPVSTSGIKIDQPSIYYGEDTNNYVIVKANTEEFDYPKGKDNVYTLYRGSGGIPLGSFFRKFLFAWTLQDMNLLISENVIKESRIMIHRNVREMVQKLAPFLRLDRDPYIVVSGGHLYWIQDAYTVAEYFPYSQSLQTKLAIDDRHESASKASRSIEMGEINYIRNSVKATVDAYNGTVNFYVVDPEDPIMATYRQIFPNVFKDFKQMPEGLKQHIRYPEDLFSIQADLYGTYHTADPQVFYNREDVWEFPKEQYAKGLIRMQPYYVIMRLPGEVKPEFILMLPMVPKNRDNMIAWLTARCDLPYYGKMIVYEFSKERLIYGPAQIEARIDQDTYISQQLTLWNQLGSKVIRGNLLVIPIDDSILYVEPIYLQAEHRQLPELKRVAVSYEDKVVMEETLDAALEKIFAVDKGTAATATAPAKLGETRPTATSAKNLAREALDRYNRAMELLKKGDWAGFGSELQSLENILKELNAENKKQQR